MHMLRRLFLVLPGRKTGWKLQTFHKMWQFPHCCGALDGKHVAVTCPNNSGSLYRNYKGYCSVVLMALVDANWCCNDAGIFNGSELKEGLNSKANIFNIPGVGLMKMRDTVPGIEPTSLAFQASVLP